MNELVRLFLITVLIVFVPTAISQNSVEICENVGDRVRSSRLLDDYRGRNVILAFTGLRCIGCGNKLSRLTEVSKHHRIPVIIISPPTENIEDIRRYSRRYPKLRFETAPCWPCEFDELLNTKNSTIFLLDGCSRLIHRFHKSAEHFSNIRTAIPEPTCETPCSDLDRRKRGDSNRSLPPVGCGPNAQQQAIPTREVGVESSFGGIDPTTPPKPKEQKIPTNVEKPTAAPTIAAPRQQIQRPIQPTAAVQKTQPPVQRPPQQSQRPNLFQKPAPPQSPRPEVRTAAPQQYSQSSQRPTPQPQRPQQPQRVPHPYSQRPQYSPQPQVAVQHGGHPVPVAAQPLVAVPQPHSAQYQRYQYQRTATVAPNAQKTAAGSRVITGRYQKYTEEPESTAETISAQTYAQRLEEQRRKVAKEREEYAKRLKAQSEAAQMDTQIGAPPTAPGAPIVPFAPNAQQQRTRPQQLQQSSPPKPPPAAPPTPSTTRRPPKSTKSPLVYSNRGGAVGPSYGRRTYGGRQPNESSYQQQQRRRNELAAQRQLAIQERHRQELEQLQRQELQRQLAEQAARQAAAVAAAAAATKTDKPVETAPLYPDGEEEVDASEYYQDVEEWTTMIPQVSRFWGDLVQ